ncbi:hypothetical protein J6590_034550 [Homalodisca vitripennis]|nr:hypothetical protein J6590_034550 [Homalodisca vitripennis]
MSKFDIFSPEYNNIPTAQQKRQLFHVENKGVIYTDTKSIERLKVAPPSHACACRDELMDLNVNSQLKQARILQPTTRQQLPTTPRPRCDVAATREFQSRIMSSPYCRRDALFCDFIWKGKDCFIKETDFAPLHLEIARHSNK